MIAIEGLAGMAAWLTERLQECELSESMLPELRQSYPDVHFTWCMDDDVGCEEAALEADAFNLYLVDGRDHCLKFTTDPEAATGVVIAEVTEE